MKNNHHPAVLLTVLCFTSFETARFQCGCSSAVPKGVLCEWQSFPCKWKPAQWVLLERAAVVHRSAHGQRISRIISRGCTALARLCWDFSHLNSGFICTWRKEKSEKRPYQCLSGSEGRGPGGWSLWCWAMGRNGCTGRSTWTWQNNSLLSSWALEQVAQRWGVPLNGDIPNLSAHNPVLYFPGWCCLRREVGPDNPTVVLWRYR